MPCKYCHEYSCCRVPCPNRMWHLRLRQGGMQVFLFSYVLLQRGVCEPLYSQSTICSMMFSQYLGATQLDKGWIDSHVTSKMQATHMAASASVAALKHHCLSGMVTTNRFLPVHLASSISPRSTTRRLRGLSGSRRRTGTVLLICAEEIKGLVHL